MFGSTILDIILGLVFIYLLLSLISSAIKEGIESWLKKRAIDLERGIKELFKDSKGDITELLFNHPLICVLYRGWYNRDTNQALKFVTGSNLPSYIPARSFAVALMDIVFNGGLQATRGTAVEERSQGDAAQGLAERVAVEGAQAAADGAQGAAAVETGTPAQASILAFRQAVLAIDNNHIHIRQALLALVDSAGNDLEKVRENIEAWFNSAMDRVSSWYKRWSQVVIFAIGVILTIGVNADTIAIITSLSQDKVVREKLLDSVLEYSKSNSTIPNGSDKLKEATKDLTRIGALGLPIGWNSSDPRTNPPDSHGWPAKLLGWLMTSFAISLGAPFWFDLLNKFVGIRSSLKPSEKPRAT